jgi:DnaK suppressor protein
MTACFGFFRQSARGFSQETRGGFQPAVLVLRVMNATQSAEIRRFLLEERERIIAEWENHGDGEWNLRDPEERATQIPSVVVERRIAEDDLNLLRKVDFALLRLDDGTYWQCAKCGNTIPLERLIAKPSASLCVPCQEDKDALKA